MERQGWFLLFSSSGPSVALPLSELCLSASLRLCVRLVLDKGKASRPTRHRGIKGEAGRLLHSRPRTTRPPTMPPAHDDPTIPPSHGAASPRFEAVTAAPPPGEQPGDMIGPYRLL